MRPTLEKWLETETPTEKTKGVEAWLKRPLPAITHRVNESQSDTAFVQFNDSSVCPTNYEDVLLISSVLRPKFDAQLVFDDLSKISRDWSLSFHKEAIEAIELCGVTGTNGKSSVAHFLAHLIASNAKLGSAAKLGTLGLETSQTFKESPNTTPFPLDLHPMLEQVHRDGDRILVLEASSHALDQNRLEGLKFKTVGFTNLTQDHLDYHETMEALFAAKSKLLDLCEGTAVVNLDCEWMSKLSQFKNTLTYSTLSNNADLFANIKEKSDHGFTLEISFEGQTRLVELPLLGMFNVSNILCALGMALSLGDASLDDYVDGLSNIVAPKGRLQIVPTRAEGRVMIDYAHTPDALASVLKTMKNHVAKGKLKLLFGCGGNRDNAKRAMMGEIASSYADRIYLTSDNPRNENPELIMDQIEKGIQNKEKCVRMVSREDAIHRALSELKADELLLLCGKGHEQTQEINGQKFRMCEEEICQTY